MLDDRPIRIVSDRAFEALVQEHIQQTGLPREASEVAVGLGGEYRLLQALIRVTCGDGRTEELEAITLKPAAPEPGPVASEAPHSGSARLGKHPLLGRRRDAHRLLATIVRLGPIIGGDELLVWLEFQRHALQHRHGWVRGVTEEEMLAGSGLTKHTFRPARDRLEARGKPGTQMLKCTRKGAGRFVKGRRATSEWIVPYPTEELVELWAAWGPQAPSEPVCTSSE